MTGDAWGMLLAVEKRHERGGSIGSDAQMAQEAGIAPHGQLTNRGQRARAAAALTELEDADIISRRGGAWVIDGEALARARAAA